VSAVIVKSGEPIDDAWTWSTSSTQTGSGSRLTCPRGPVLEPAVGRMSTCRGFPRILGWSTRHSPETLGVEGSRNVRTNVVMDRVAGGYQ
jgi:hypothetical protein